MRAYAKHRGVSVEAVSKAVKRGRITCNRNEKGHAMIDPEIADKQWAENSDESKVREPEPEPELEQKKPGYSHFRGIREGYAAKLAQLEYEQKTGRLIDGEEVRQLWITIASIARTRILAIPSKARQQIPELKLEHYITLEKIVRETLEGLADEGKTE